jgi:aspartyl-tRNA(Asn)/glutamyl-tRNA(Gln) amidotransferase subunit C
MSISRAEILSLANISKISLSETEIANFTTDLENIINHVSQLNELNTKGVNPTTEVHGLQNIWRSDEITPPAASPEDLLSLAAETKDRQIKVPKVL